jgi:hypothetical protein
MSFTLKNTFTYVLTICVMCSMKAKLHYEGIPGVGDKILSGKFTFEWVLLGKNCCTLLTPCTDVLVIKTGNLMHTVRIGSQTICFPFLSISFCHRIKVFCSFYWWLGSCIWGRAERCYKNDKYSCKQIPIKSFFLYPLYAIYGEELFWISQYLYHQVS